MSTYGHVPAWYTSSQGHHVYVNGVLPSRPHWRSSYSSSGLTVQSSPAWTVQSSPPSLSSPRGPPEAPRPRTIPLPAVQYSHPYNWEHHRPTSFPQPRNPPDHVYRQLNGASIDPHLATPQHPTAKPSLTWDLMLQPATALRRNPAISPAELRRSAVRSSGWNKGQPVNSLVLMFPYLPMEIEIRPSRGWTSLRDSRSSFVTVWDVLEGLYHGLRAPIDPQDFMGRSETERSTLLRASERRRRSLPGDAFSRNALLKIDYLGRRRRFLGIRPALPYELPSGRKSGEVYIVEVGLCD